jgi:hypothetical protein
MVWQKVVYCQVIIAQHVELVEIDIALLPKALAAQV